MTNAEYHNINMISSLRQPKAPLTPIQLGGPLAAHTFTELHRGQHETSAQLRTKAEKAHDQILGFANYHDRNPVQ
eukprot:COSAG05_NODE_1610_length_4408_cov_4.339290_6_plen_75_part_00